MLTTTRWVIHHSASAYNAQLHNETSNPYERIACSEDLFKLDFQFNFRHLKFHYQDSNAMTMQHRGEGLAFFRGEFTDISANSCRVEES